MTTPHAVASPLTILFALVRSMRPKQWLKNVACFAGLVFSGQLFQPRVQAAALLAFVAFSLIASAVYLLNDLLDRTRDRANPRTASRPLASGLLPPWVALLSCLGLALASAAMARALGIAAFLCLVVYASLNVVYSLRLNRTVIADVMCIALGFVLRVLFGVYAVGVRPTPWILLCMFFLALLLGFSKRKGELASLGEDSGTSRPVLGKYSLAYLDMVIGMMCGMTILTYSLYSVSSHHNPSLVVTVVPVVYCVLRYGHQVIVKGRGESPEEILLSDPMLAIGILCWMLLCVAVLYTDLPLLIEHPAK